MAMLASEAFAYADATSLAALPLANDEAGGSLSVSWAIAGAAAVFQTLSQRVVTSAGPATQSMATVNVATTDHSVKCTLHNTVGTPGVGAGVCARFVDVNNHYAFYQYKNADSIVYYRLTKFVAGVETELYSNFLPSPSGDDVIQLTVSGNVLTAYVNGAVFAIMMDDDLAAGTRTGIWAYNGGTKWDYFETWSGFVYADSYATLFDQALPTDVGVALSPHDLWAHKFFVCMAVPNGSAAIWDAPTGETGWDGTDAIWDDTDILLWTDITSRVRGLEWDHGAPDTLSLPETGTAQLTLDNQDGELSPWATTGPYTNPVDLEPFWDDGLWDVGVPGSGASVIRPGLVVRLASTYVDPNGSMPMPDEMPGMRNDGTRVWWTGFLDTVDESTSENVDGWVTWHLTDVMGQAAAIPNGTGVMATTAAHLDASNMLDAILSEIAFQYVPAAGMMPTYDAQGGDNTYTDVFIQPGDPSFYVDAPDVTANRLAALQQVCASADVHLIGGTRGYLVVNTGPMTAADHLMDDPEGSGLVFTNNPDRVGSFYEMPVVDVAPYSNTDRLLNYVFGERHDGTGSSTSQDVDSQVQFGTRGNGLGWPRQDLLCTTGVVPLLTQAIVDRHSNDYLGISEISIDCDQAPDELYNWVAILAESGVEHGVEFPVRWLHPSGSVFTLVVRTIGIAGSMTMEGDQAKLTATIRVALVALTV